MKIYLAARYSRRDELRIVRSELIKLGHTVVSTWLDTDWEEGRVTTSSTAPLEYREKYVEIDLEDVASCDCLIAFTEQPRSEHSRGGRHVEFGYALAINKELIVVGCRENLFYHHPRVEVFETTEAMLSSLKKR